MGPVLCSTSSIWDESSHVLWVRSRLRQAEGYVLQLGGAMCWFPCRCKDGQVLCCLSSSVNCTPVSATGPLGLRTTDSICAALSSGMTDLASFQMILASPSLSGRGGGPLCSSRALSQPPRRQDGEKASGLSPCFSKRP